MYGVPLFLAAVARNRRLLRALAACLIFMTFATYAALTGPGVFSLVEPYFINRVLPAAPARRGGERPQDAVARFGIARYPHPLTTIDLIADLVLRSGGWPARAV